MSNAKLTERITGELSRNDLKWIEGQLPSIPNPVHRILVLILLFQVRALRATLIERAGG
jgi:hypothetical protein